MGESLVKVARRRDSRQLRRQWKLLRLLWGAREGRTVLALARELGTSKSTIERDLATLEQDFAIHGELDGHRMRYRYVGERPPAPPMRFGMLEAVTMEAGASRLGPLRSRPFEDHSREARDKAQLSMAREWLDCEAARRMGQVFRDASPGIERHDGDLLLALVDAAVRGRRAVIDYRSPYRDRSREITTDVHRIVTRNGAVYCLCRSPRHGKLYWLAVRRMRWCRVLRDPVDEVPAAVIDAEVPRDFGIWTEPGAEEDVVIEFDASAADEVLSSEHHPDERKEALEGGGLRYRVRTSCMHEVLSWVLGFGGRARLLAPSGWRQELVQRAQAMLAGHGEPGAGAAED